jgi:hypothetical protein
MVKCGGSVLLRCRHNGSSVGCWEDSKSLALLASCLQAFSMLWHGMNASISVASCMGGSWQLVAAIANQGLMKGRCVCARASTAEIERHNAAISGWCAC